MLEYIGVLVLIAIVVAAVFASGLAGTVARSALRSVTCVVSGSECHTPATRTATAASQRTATTASQRTATTASQRTATTASQVTPNSGCGQDGQPFTGPLLAGESHCRLIGSNQICQPQIRGNVSFCEPISQPSALASLPVAPPATKPFYPVYDASCAAGYNFHYAISAGKFNGDGYCAWAGWDPDPTKLKEDPDHIVEQSLHADIGPQGLAKAFASSGAADPTDVDPVVVEVNPHTIDPRLRNDPHYQQFMYGGWEADDFAKDLEEQAEKLYDTADNWRDDQEKEQELEEKCENLAEAQAEAQYRGFEQSHGGETPEEWEQTAPEDPFDEDDGE